ncbi:hypothetical protein CW751_08560 [Brumimicrobium salinarum]|uniref:Uncharacterized protein n=2 Tax=Brumimicrobium salinarum TaxID=2058658 RepID=A0A2I0R338_9FLAO|nr:hypothetical protein CW751_08560 [Brumimicrobium salinarum]
MLIGCSIEDEEDIVANGFFEVFNKDSVLLESGYMRNGKKDSIFLHYHLNGQIKSYTQYDNGIPVFSRYDLKENGDFIRYCYYDNTGKRVYVCRYENEEIVQEDGRGIPQVELHNFYKLDTFKILFTLVTPPNYSRSLEVRYNDSLVVKKKLGNESSYTLFGEHKDKEIKFKAKLYLTKENTDDTLVHFAYANIEAI